MKNDTFNEFSAGESKTVSSQGVAVYGYKNPHLHGFCLCMYVRAGSMYESDNQNGISHFWEHTLFRNINCVCGGDLYKRIDTLGAVIDACTYREFIQIKISGASEKLRECALLLMKVFSKFQAPASDVDLERKRIKSEIREIDDKASLDGFTRRLVWKNTSMANPIIGKRSVLDKIGAKALASFQESILTPDNIFFCLTGAFDDDDERYIAELIDSYSITGVRGEKRDNLAPVPDGFMNRNAQIEVKSDRYCRIRFNFDVDCSRYNTAEQYLLYDILFANENAIIFKALSEDSGLVYSYDSCLEKYTNIGNLYFCFEVSGAKLEQAIEKVMCALNSLRQKPYDELEATKSAYIVNTGLLLDEPGELNFELGYEYKIMGLEFESLEKRRESFIKVTPERIQEIAREIFRPENLVLTLSGNKKRLDTEKIASLLRFE